MTTTRTYEGVLAPVGVSIADASDSRSFSVDIEAQPTWEGVQEAVLEQVADTGVVDAWALSNHWELAHLRQSNADDAQQLRDALRSSRPLPPNGVDTEPFEFNVLDYRTNDWHELTLVLEEDVADEYRLFQSSINNQNIASFCLDAALLHEATVRAVAMADDPVIDAFETNPVDAQSQFIHVALQYKSLVKDQLNTLTL